MKESNKTKTLIIIDKELLKKAKMKAIEEDKTFSSVVNELLIKWINE